MVQKNYQYIYGPVASWRLGSSLGIDPISMDKKVCSFDCFYCQLGKTWIHTVNRNKFVSVEGLLDEITSLPSLQIDYITISGSGEPTLADNLGEMIKAIRRARKEKIAVITNSSVIDRIDVQKDLMLADFVIAKLDAPSQDIFETINKPLKTIKFDKILQGIKDFKTVFKGKLALQIMFFEENKKYAGDIARIAGEIYPDEVQINTPLRPCRVKPLSENELLIIEKYFDGLNAVNVYKSNRKTVKPVSAVDTLKRRGKT